MLRGAALAISAGENVVVSEHLSFFVASKSVFAVPKSFIAISPQLVFEVLNFKFKLSVNFKHSSTKIVVKSLVLYY